MEFLHSPSFWVGVSFFIFVFLVIAKGGKGILASLDARGEAIRKTLEEAQNLREEAQKTLAEYKRKQRDALKEAEEIVEHAKAEAIRVGEESAKELEVSLKRREQQAMDKINQAEAAALNEVRNQAVDVAISATKAILSSSITKPKAKALLDDSISALDGKFH
ncbi:F0F1 ATP synthase subunit B [Kiloniella laminariae]|uniref:ATP synthase subunit b n=1 Tax=Kiloniella laminariae TaxID=454162 RepID=A0ABT4LPC2_9PROT|nr:F0F1 ATP synthase subunit B [Kiloniella laminariae]MCZ4281802.1 F0F1 ATP synthase subunit B [Kiloniella laminariae]